MHLVGGQKGVCRCSIKNEVLGPEHDFCALWIDCFENNWHCGWTKFAGRVCIKSVTLANFTLGPDSGVNGSHVLPPTWESAPPSGTHMSCMWLTSTSKCLVCASEDMSFLKLHLESQIMDGNVCTSSSSVLTHSSVCVWLDEHCISIFGLSFWLTLEDALMTSLFPFWGASIGFWFSIHI